MKTFPRNILVVEIEVFEMVAVYDSQPTPKQLLGNTFANFLLCMLSSIRIRPAYFHIYLTRDKI